MQALKATLRTIKKSPPQHGSWLGNLLNLKLVERPKSYMELCTQLMSINYIENAIPINMQSKTTDNHPQCSHP